VPGTGVVAAESLTLNSSTTRNFNLNVPALVTVSGNVTANGGAVPLYSWAEYGCVRLDFISVDDSLPTEYVYPCADNGWSYEVELYAGTYRVIATGGDGAAVPGTGV